MAKNMKIRRGNDGFSYPYTSPDLVVDENGKSATTKFNELEAKIGTGSGTSIDDVNTSTDKTWSSSKIDSQFKEIVKKDFVTYEDYGAIGDGVTDDYLAIYNAHTYANSNNLKIKTNDKAIYMLKSISKPIPIKTDVDWGCSKFIINDKNLSIDTAKINVFEVVSEYNPIDISISSLNKNTTYLEEIKDYDGLIIIENSNKKQFIRRGVNSDEGKPQTEIIRCSKGMLKDDILWDYEVVTKCQLYKKDEKRITIEGGIFTTLGNTLPNEYGDGVARGILVRRSNVIMKNITHYMDYTDVITSKPYNGWIFLDRTKDVILENLNLDAHKTFTDTNGVNMGNYDICLNLSSNINLIGIYQNNIIDSEDNWGICVTNYCKNIFIDRYNTNRFDAHRGIHNLVIHNSNLKALNLVGSGIAKITDTLISGEFFIYLREDYGATWNGTIIVDNCTFTPNNSMGDDLTFLFYKNDASHDFGYKCYFPNIEIKNLTINNPRENQNLVFIYNKCNTTNIPIDTKSENEYETENLNGRYPYIFKEFIKINNITVLNKCNTYIFYDLPQYCYRDKKNSVVFNNTVTNNSMPICSIISNYNILLDNMILDDFILNIKANDISNYNNYRLIPTITIKNSTVKMNIKDNPMLVYCDNNKINKVITGYGNFTGNIEMNKCTIGDDYNEETVISASNKNLYFNKCLFLLKNPSDATLDILKNTYSFFSVCSEFDGKFRMMVRLNNCIYNFNTSLIITNEILTKYDIDENILNKNVNFNWFSKI